MLKPFQLGSWTMLVCFPPTLPCSSKITSFESENRCSSTCCTLRALNNVVSTPQVYLSMRCAARRRVRYHDDEDESEDDEESKEHNKEISLLELYSQSVRGEALIVHAMVDDQPVEVLIFKGFSSCLSYRTPPDPSKSILPARAVIESIDRVKGPFDPSNIEYLQKDLSWEVFKSNLPPNLHMVCVKSSLPGRWGHTLSCLNGSLLVVFGGNGRQGLLNDVFVLDLDSKQPTWKEVYGGTPPLPRSWHSSCMMDSKLVVSGGVTDAGVLLSDTYVLDLTTDHPTWKEIPTKWSPPSRLGHSLSVYGRSKILMFGGLANSGHLKLRSGETYTIDLEDEEPQWRQLECDAFTSIDSRSAVLPPPRLDHVAVSMPCGRIIIFGGSIAGLHSPSQLFILDPSEEKPSWRILNVPGQPPKYAWGHSTCVVGGTRVLVLGGHTVEE